MNNEELFKYMTENRKLKIEEYDDNGNLIDVREFSDNILFDFVNSQINNAEILSVARVKDLNMFTDDELSIVNKIIFSCFSNNLYLKDKNEKFIDAFTNEVAIELRHLMNNTKKDVFKFALKLATEGNYTFNVSLKSEYAFKKFTLLEAIEFIECRDGIYYAIDNNGKNIYDFVDRPTKKQVKYQRTKNGNRTVFLNFKDWKEYIIDENEL